MTSETSPFDMSGLVIGAAAGIIAILGCVQAGVGTMLLRRFTTTAARQARHQMSRRPGSSGETTLPPVTILKPLHGDEPRLEQALESFCVQHYPDYQIVFGVQDPMDPAIAVVRALQARFPDRPMDLVVSETQHGPNRKIGNLINMLPAARHDILVISDSDIHAEPCYLHAVTEALAEPGVGLVTTLYGGIPSDTGLTRRSAAAQVNHNFLPGVLMSRLLGRQDCLGATMALRRDTLEAVGGLPMLSPHLADDSALGKAVRAAGGSIAIARTMTRTTIADRSLGEMYAHELRWGRTVRSVEPLGYAASAIQLPLFWASLTVLVSPLAIWSWALLFGVWSWRFAMARLSDHVIGTAPGLPLLLLPVRDWMSALVMVNSFRGRTVAWRGHVIDLPARNRSVQRPAAPLDTGRTIAKARRPQSNSVRLAAGPETLPQTVE